MSATTFRNLVPWPIGMALMAACIVAAAGFGVLWPLGLAILVCLIGSGKMMCCGPMVRWKDDLHRVLDVGHGGRRSSGNMAFDAYREATLKRLEEEQRAFGDFLGQLRAAKDREEFERFMAERAARQPQ